MRKSKPSTAIIHPRKLPFSEAEVYQAFRLCFPIRLAKTLAREALEAVREEQWRELRAARARAAGSTDPGEINSGVVLLQPGLPVLLALVSSELRARVDNWRISQRRVGDATANGDASWNETLRVAAVDLQRCEIESTTPGWVLFDLRQFS